MVAFRSGQVRSPHASVARRSGLAELCCVAASRNTGECKRRSYFCTPSRRARPKASCLHVAFGRHGASLRRAGGFDGCRPLQVVMLTHRFRPTLQRPTALLPTRARPSSVRADGRAHELNFRSHMRHRPVCIRDAVVFFVKNTKLSVLSALRSTRLRPAPHKPPVRSRILERSVSSES